MLTLRFSRSRSLSLLSTQSVYSRILSSSSPPSSTSTPKKKYIGNGVLGIVSETYNKWERRCPITPQHCRILTKKNGYKVLIQPSNHRIFTNSEFEAAGALITDDLSSACTILGVKQIKSELLLPDKSYLFFSHVIKGQPENLPLLQDILDKDIRLIDYECITEGGKRNAPRLVAFGRYAGIAGMIDTFLAVGQRLLARGFSTPFLNSPNSYMYRDLISAKFGVSSMGRDIGNGGLPEDLEPLVFCFTGRGNVGEGAREIFELLPHKWITLPELVELKSQGGGGMHTCVYGLNINEEEMVRKIDGEDEEVFDVQHYRKNPSLYEPIFHEKVLPYCNVLVNGMYWDARYPRLLTSDQLSNLRKTGNSSFFCLSDITCDIGGSVEFFSKSTQIECPYYHFNPLTREVSNDGTCVVDNDVIIQGVDILPSELPKESSKHFGDALLPLLPSLLDADSKGCNIIDSATIAYDGKLTDNFKYIEQLKRDFFTQQKLEQKQHDSLTFCMVEMEGHIFDSGLLKTILDILEVNGCAVEIVECTVGGGKNLSGVSFKSNAVLKISAAAVHGEEEFNVVVRKILEIVPHIPTSEAKVSVSHGNKGKAIKPETSSV